MGFVTACISQGRRSCICIRCQESQSVERGKPRSPGFSRWWPPRVRSNLIIDSAKLRRAALSDGCDCEVCTKSRRPARPELNKNHLKRVYSGCPKPRKKLISDRICCEIRTSTKRERPLSFLNWSGHEGRRMVHARRQHPLKTHPPPAPCDKEKPMWHILSRTSNP